MILRAKGDKCVINYIAVTKRLIKSGRYPAIIFLFSRRLVEEQALAAAGSLAVQEVIEEEIKQQIQDRIAEVASPSALKLHGTLFKCLKSGVGYHHAGLLPSVKRLVEELFVSGFLPVVFCTETFALGVNYPARAVVIGQVTKRDDEGYRALRNREILQMAGRAGRRGQDRTGYVYFCIDPSYPEEAPVMAPETPEPVRPSTEYVPESVLRIIAGLGSDRNILEKYVIKSFTAYSAEVTKEKAQKEWLLAKEAVDAEMQSKGCVNIDGCLAAWNGCRPLRNEISQLEGKVGQARKSLKNARKKNHEQKIRKFEADISSYQEEIKKCREKMDTLLLLNPGCGYSGPKECHVFTQFKKNIERCRSLYKKYCDLPDARRASWGYFERIVGSLIDTGFLTPEWELTDKGRLALDASAGGILLAEILSRLMEKGSLDSMTSEELAGLAAGCLCESEKDNSVTDGVESDALRFLWDSDIEKYYSIEMCEAVSSWAGGAPLEKCAAEMETGPGDFVLLARRAAEVLRGLAHGDSCSISLKQKAKAAYKLVWKGEVAEVL